MPAVLAVIVFLAACSLSFLHYVVNVRFAAERETIQRPDGARFDVLVNRDRVMLFTKRAAVWNLYSIWPVLIGVIRNRGWKPWRWVVTVRQAPFAGYPNLVREVFEDRPSAEARADELSDAIRNGARFWPADAGM